MHYKRITAGDHLTNTKRTKFNVDMDLQKRTYDGISFDSQMEMRYYRDVVLPQVRSGKIKNYELQKKYILQPKFILNGKTVQPIVYVADFFIEYSDGSVEVIDTKGYSDSVAKIKRKMFWYTYPHIPYRWICYSKIDGTEENNGWCDYEYVQECRRRRKKKNNLKKQRRKQTVITTNKNEKISVNAFEKAVGDDYKYVETINWRGLPIVVKRFLTLNDTLAFSNSVTKSCFEKETGVYLPEIKEFAIRSCVIEYYTNISLPTNVEKRFSLLCETDLFDTILSSIDQIQFQELVKAIDQKIAHLAQASIEAISRQMNDLYASIESLCNQFETAFRGVDGDALNKIFAALSGGQLDEEKLANAIIASKKKENDV